MNQTTRSVGRKRKVEGDITQDILEHKRCPQCKEETTISSYISKKNGKITKTCKTCREKVLACVYAKDRPNSYSKKYCRSERLRLIKEVLDAVLDIKGDSVINQEMKDKINKLI